MSIDDIQHFLVVYDVAALKAAVTKFDDYDEALEAYDAVEKRYLDDSNFDVVLLGADSLETIKRTHSSYFETTAHGFERFFKRELAGR